jgi:uncharacterized protein involved in exopolysaccharide biosynthesis
VTFNLFLKRYWRIPLVAVLAALLAFGASFAEKPSYKSTSRLMIVEGNSNVLNSSGNSTTGLTGVDDSTSAEALSETYAGLASSRQVATIVVNKLNLAAPKASSHGPIHWLEGALATTYAHTKAWVTFGFYKTPPRREKAIQTTEAAIKAADLAPAGGADTGQTDSYVIELDGTGDTGLQASQIANTAADALVTVGQQQFQHDSSFFAKSLQTQLKNANATLATDNNKVSSYEGANHITSLDQQLTQAAQNSGTFQAQLVSAQAAVQGDKQTVASLQATLAGTDPTESSDQSITTGRSTTADNTTQANPVYQTVQEQLTQAQAALASENATVSSLQGEVSSNPSSSLTTAQAGLLDLEQKVTADQNSIQSLSSSLGQAKASAATSPVTLTRLGTADVPTYPFSPKRYLFLLLGVLLGALAGIWLTFLARRRRLPEDDGRDIYDTSGTAEYDFRQAGDRQLVGAGVGNGFGRRIGDNSGVPYNGGNGHNVFNRRASDHGNGNGNGNGRHVYNRRATDHVDGNGNGNGAGNGSNGYARRDADHVFRGDEPQAAGPAQQAVLHRDGTQTLVHEGGATIDPPDSPKEPAPW